MTVVMQCTALFTKLMLHFLQASSTEKPAGKKHDKEFDPSAEMMVNDFDDERTLDEEEALEGSEDPKTELSNLQKVWYIITAEINNSSTCTHSYMC